MPVSTEPRSRRSVELLVACCAVLGLLFAAGCSSDSGSSTDASDTTIGADADTDGDSDTDTDGDAGGDTDSTELPDGFPDIPVPDFTSVAVIVAGNETMPSWSVIMRFDPADYENGDAIVAAYQTQLEAAGYATRTAANGATVQATKGVNVITFHSPDDDTLSVAVIGG